MIDGNDLIYDGFQYKILKLSEEFSKEMVQIWDSNNEIIIANQKTIQIATKNFFKNVTIICGDYDIATEIIKNVSKVKNYEVNLFQWGNFNSLKIDESKVLEDDVNAA